MPSKVLAVRFLERATCWTSVSHSSLLIKTALKAEASIVEQVYLSPSQEDPTWEDDGLYLSKSGLAPLQASIVHVCKQRCSGTHRCRCCISVAYYGIGEGLVACGAPGPPQSGSKLACPDCS